MNVTCRHFASEIRIGNRSQKVLLISFSLFLCLLIKPLLGLLSMLLVSLETISLNFLLSDFIVLLHGLELSFNLVNMVHLVQFVILGMLLSQLLVLHLLESSLIQLLNMALVDLELLLPRVEVAPEGLARHWHALRDGCHEASLVGGRAKHLPIGTLPQRVVSLVSCVEERSGSSCVVRLCTRSIPEFGAG